VPKSYSSVSKIWSMSKISEMDRDNLEEYARELKHDNEILFRFAKAAEEYIKESEEIDEEMLGRINDALEKDRPDITHYDTCGVEEALSDLKETVEDHNGMVESWGEDKS
jgi:5-methylcytosine-specific restriction endonuclease McrBC regulatory subunit McrC